MPAQERFRPGASLFDVIDRRRSVRVFRGDPIDDHLLGRILQAANAAPSAGNLQAYELYVVREQGLREQLAAAALSQNFLAAAPVVLVFCANERRNRARYGERGRSLYALEDATIACTFAMLAATALGLATVWVGAFSDDDSALAPEPHVTVRHVVAPETCAIAPATGPESASASRRRSAPAR